MDDDRLSIVLFSGTDDRLQAAATLISGAVAMGRSVDVLLQYWALDAFRADRINKDHGVSAEAGVEGAAAMRRQREREHGTWVDLLHQAKTLGEVNISACSHSMEMLELTRADLDRLVTNVHGIATFMATATGPITFI